MIDPRKVKFGVVSYEIIYQVLDRIDTINELNSKIDNKEGKLLLQVESIIQNVEEILKKVEDLRSYWENVRDKMKK